MMLTSVCTPEEKHQVGIEGKTMNINTNFNSSHLDPGYMLALWGNIGYEKMA